MPLGLERPAPLRPQNMSLTACLISLPLLAGAPKGDLVVAIVVDQLPTWIFDQVTPHLPTDGGFRRAISTGTYVKQVHYEYAGTYTAAGHASIFSGTRPRTHGIAANEVFDPKRDRPVSAADMGQHPVHAPGTGFASPLRLTGPSIVDQHRQATGARTVAISLKRRAAVLSGGRKAHVAVWYDKGAGRFVSSTYYRKRPLPWLERWQGDAPWHRMCAEWPTPASPWIWALQPVDGRRGEANWLGLGRNFPHRCLFSEAPQSTLRAMPLSTKTLFSLAREAIQSMDLGRHPAAPELLILSISGLDYAGHTFGPRSVEYLDHLRQLDLDLAAFARAVQRIRRTRFFLTSDHGAAPLPEYVGPAAIPRNATEDPDRPGRLRNRSLIDGLETHLNSKFPGSGPFVKDLVRPFILLRASTPPGPTDAAIRRTALVYLNHHPKLEAAFDASTLRQADRPAPGLAGLAWASTPPAWPGDIYFVPRQHVVLDPQMEAGHGTGHGTPWPYDRYVPGLVWGPGISKNAVSGESMRQFSQRLAAMLARPLRRRSR